MDQESLISDLEYISRIRPLPVGESLSGVLARLDELARKPELPDRLRHYLAKRSYVKALAWLSNPEMPHQP